MSDLSPELNLALAVDDDDTADYLVTTQGLRGNMLTLDGLFNATTGHAHNGSHQGGVLQFQDLTVGRNLTVVGAADFKSSVLMETTLHVVGAATLDSTLAVGGTLTVTGASLLTGGVTMQAGLNVIGAQTISGGITAAGDVQGRYLISDDGSNGVVRAGHGTLYLRGTTVSVDQGSLTVATSISAGGYVSAGPTVSGGAGDLSANRSNNTGYVFLANGTHYLGFDGTNYQMPTSQLYVQGQQVATSDNAMTLNQKTLGDPKVTGQATLGGGSYTFPSVVGNAGMWRYVKAWGSNMTILLTNGTFILGGTQYSSGQYTLTSGDSVSTYCDGSNWWVI